MCEKYYKILHIFPIVGSLIVVGYFIVTTIQRQYSLYNLSLFMYADMILAKYCKYAFRRLPPGEKSLRKSVVKFAQFLLSSGMLLALVSQSAPFYGLLAAAPLYALAGGGSVFLFYLYMIYDGGDGGVGENCAFCEEEKHAFSVVELNSVSEKV